MKSRIYSSLFSLINRVVNKDYCASSEKLGSKQDLKYLLDSEFLQNKGKHANKSLHLGDSVLLRTACEDCDTRDLSSLLAGEIGLDVVRVAGTAFHPELHCAVLAYLERQSCKPDIVFLGLNLRSFGPQMQFHPDWYYEDTLKGLGWDPTYLVDSRSYDDIVVNVDENETRQMGEYLLIANSTPKTPRQAEQRQRIIHSVHYAFDIKASLRLSFVKRSCEIAKRAGFRLFAYITPINHVAFRNFASDWAMKRLLLSVAQIESLLKREVGGGVAYGNYWDLCGQDSFFSPEIANEHLNEHGRKMLVRSIVEDSRIAFDLHKTMA
ncbi:MAG: hypothetical protein A2283_10470 [Lentisphaerae bacterium RIFOXYA12_FULL_48_11]|nr:MAG: hypothetical protein A2283_10470 [Lentisphaerae bacterium RIFOXYA12_FULL_48_11]